MFLSCLMAITHDEPFCCPMLVRRLHDAKPPEGLMMNNSTPRRARKTASPRYGAHDPVLTPAELAALGAGQVAYVKAMTSDEVARIYPQAPQLEPGLALFALLGADGSPILLTDSRDAAAANAWEHDLTTVSLH
jgi:hypothetical protein